MAYQRFRNGFEVQTASAIDKRVKLTKAQMATADQDFMMPEVYFAICEDDGRLYIYDENNELDQDLGRFRPVDETLTDIHEIIDSLELDGGLIVGE